MRSADALVTGTSMLCSLGVGNEAVWEGVSSQKQTRGERTYEMRDGRTLCYPVYPMERLDLRDWLQASACRWLQEEQLDQDADFVSLVVAARLAMQEAGLPAAGEQTVALVIGHENAGVVPLMDRLLADPDVDGGADGRGDALASFRRHQEAFFRIQTFTYPFYLAKALQITGPSYIINNACATGIYALEHGRQLVLSGQADAAVVVCSDYAHATEHLWLGQKGLISPTQELRPFDRRRNGSVLGDAAAAFVLESPSHAAKRQVRPICAYKGSRLRQDNWHITLPDVAAHSYSRAMVDAITQVADYQPPDLLIPHGTGSPLWDHYEAVEIHRAFAGLSCEVPPVTGFKSAVGHTLGACSLLESALAVHCLVNNVIPPLQDYAEEDPKIRLPVVTKGVERKLRSVMKTVSAYGGFHAAAVFEQLVQGE
ncbi:beta-ketoacyl synthase [Brevibacillus humidisoli]|uniref:beta-ketoacyl synthase N-terminal-like domain-containing protein n=1 Tax=Brevibacillus humidisoli TaxID=2895522 RepID=UPI001E5F49B2|nr:beta-ketoacyl synthase N-terminal-like domain-containing protein [Brevibacillus humidisoli]UFJ42431.1 beta-ketoacyl synthase [Brevibacillus humidisoli]